MFDWVLNMPLPLVLTLNTFTGTYIEQISYWFIGMVARKKYPQKASSQIFEINLFTFTYLILIFP